MAIPNQCPAQWQNKMDRQEWTIPEQKTYLQSKQAGYGIACDQKKLLAWLSVELWTYFELFPPGPVTVKENMDHPGLTDVDKRLFEAMVSDSSLKENVKTLTIDANSESRLGLRITVALQHK